MAYTFFKHTCVISRPDGWDEDGNDKFIPLYEGQCMYQERDNVAFSGGLLQGSPNVYLPANDVVFAKDDRCIITVEKGRVIEAVIDNLRDMDGELIKGTKIMLKQSKD